jgi:two-component system chemotaxis sensor kinase CheA
MELDREALMPVFLAEADEMLAQLEESLLALEDAPGDAELIGTIFRAAHTIKGNAEAIGFDAIGAGAHALEDVLTALRKGKVAVSHDIVSLLLEGHDVLRALLQVAATSGTPSLDDHREVIERLGNVRADAAGASTEAAPISTKVGGSAPAPSRKTLRVDVRTLDRILTATGELSIANARVRGDVEAAASTTSVLDALSDSERIFAELREQVMRLRLVPVGPIFRAQIRVVRDLAVSLGKRARVVIEGHDVEVDTSVVDALRPPLTHMIRNAIDHGVESPSVRRAAGKNPIGTITLRARHEAGRLVVEVKDDGAGFHRARILERARAQGLVAGDGATMRDRDVYELVFAPGFSTRDEVTDVSGRGVGMDVVSRSVSAIGGSLAVESNEGHGATITIRAPLTLSIIAGFAVTAAEQTYVLPLESVRECIELPVGEERHGDGTGVVNVRGEALPYLRLRDLFSVSGGTIPARESVVLVEHAGARAGLAVDGLRGESQAVVKPLDRLLRGSDAITGSTILGDGRVALVLDVPAIFQEATRRQRARGAIGART